MLGRHDIDALILGIGALVAVGVGLARCAAADETKDGSQIENSATGEVLLWDADGKKWIPAVGEARSPVGRFVLTPGPNGTMWEIDSASGSVRFCGNENPAPQRHAPYCSA